MTVDIVLIVVLALSILMGVLRGALLEVLSLLAFGAALLFCQALGRVLLPGAAYLMPNASALAVHAAATVFAGLMILLVGTAITAVIVRLARKGGKRFTTPDRVIGGALGGCRAILIWLVVACFAPAPNGVPATSIGRQMRQSALVSTANRANPLLRVPFVRDARTLQRLLRDRDRQVAFFTLPETRTFLAHPRVQSAIREGRLEERVAQSDLTALIRAPAIQAALLEPGVLPLLRRALAAHRRHA